MPLNVVVVLGSIATVVLTVLIYVLIMPKSRYANLNGFFKWLHNFFHFKKLYIEAVIRFFYVLENVACVGFGVFLLVGKIDMWYRDKWTFLYGLGLIVLGPIVLRLVYECVMLSILLVKNTMEINNRLSGNTDNASFATGSTLAEKLSNVAVTAASGAAAAVQQSNQAQKQQQYTQQYGQPYPQQQYGQPQQYAQPVQPAAPAQPVAPAPAPEAPADPAAEAPAAEAAPVCPKCGTPITGNGKFCFKCGAPLQ